MKTSGADTRYAYAVARIRVLERRLLPGSSFERILEQDDVSSCLRVLSEFNGYSRAASSITDAENFEDFFLKELLNTYELVYDLAREKDVVKPFLKKFDIITQYSKETNIEKIDYFIWGIFYDAWKDNQFLNEYLKISFDLENIKIFFRIKLQQKKRGFFSGSILTGGYIKTKDILNLFDDEITGENILKLWGSRYSAVLSNLVEEYRGRSRISDFEKSCDNLLIDYIKRAKYFHFGVEPVVCYALAKENEIRNLRIILEGKKNNFEIDETRPFLRRSYV